MSPARRGNPFAITQLLITPMPVKIILRPVIVPPPFTLGSLYLSSMPGRFEPLADFFDQIRAARVNHIVCLVSEEEIAKKSPSYLAAIQTGQLPALLSRLPIPDYGIPDQIDKITLEMDRLRSLLGGGDSVVIHCAAGCGRTGMVATMLLVRMGLPLAEATAIIRQASSAPETPEQRRYLERYHRTQLPPENLPEDQ
jgi:protein-tyrosine phosphatase